MKKLIVHGAGVWENLTGSTADDKLNDFREIERQYEDSEANSGLVSELGTDGRDDRPCEKGGDWSCPSCGNQASFHQEYLQYCHEHVLGMSCAQET